MADFSPSLPLIAACFLLACLVLALLRTRHDLRTLRTDRDALAREAFEDELTHAKSRRYLAQYVDHPDRPNDVSLIMIDMDDYRTVNDGYGQKIGDDLIVAISETIQTNIAEPDFVARLSGDEFCIVTHQGPENASNLGTSLVRQIFETAVQSGNNRVRRSASIGVAHLGAQDRLVDGLVVAESAMRAVKARGGNGAQMADPSVHDQLAQRRAKPTIERLRSAVDQGEVTYHVQPIWDLEHGTAAGVEALIRWERDGETTLLPDDFLDTMTTNYHHALRPPLEQANRAAMAFTQLTPPLYCAFNISSSFLKRTRELSPTWVTDLLDGLPPERIMFEIVETAVIEDPEHALKVLQDLRAEGVRIALDDFGTGLSNLERLSAYPIDIVKVDRRFVHGIADDERKFAILSGMVDLSNTMGFEIVAEGVETEAELEKIRSVGIKFAQGYLLGRPAPVEDWLRRLS